jgi:predicted NAD/FAD-dependent oxidoreductase
MTPSVVIVGAGMSGLSAARRLVAGGFHVTVLDKGRAVGGRMATRRFGGAAVDHGAQHISVRNEGFAAVMGRLVAGGVARVWLRTPSVTRPERGVEPRYAGIGGIRRIPEALAEDLDIVTGTRVERLVIDSGRVSAVTAGGMRATADAVVLTAPIPQALNLLRASNLSAAVPDDLASIGYDATLAVMAILDEDPCLPDGHLALDTGPVAWIADNRHKGASHLPALTIHSSPSFAADRLDDDPGLWMDRLLESARPHHRGSVVEAISHRWRYAAPQQARDDGAVALDTPVPVILAGEAFSGARVEGAFTSGLAAARLVEEVLGT